MLRSFLDIFDIVSAFLWKIILLKFLKNKQKKSCF